MAKKKVAAKKGKGRGGSRSGAGRKAGQRNKFSVALVEAAQATGELPHQFLLRVMRGESLKSGKQTVIPSLEQRITAAIAAAPYFAPRLATVEAKTEITHNFVIGSDPLPDKEFREKYGVIEAEGFVELPDDVQ